MKRQTTYFLATLLAIFAVLFAAGCGKGGADNASNGAGDMTPDRSVRVTANDQMKFNLERIEATAGEVIRLTLDNVGTMPKFSMGHNLVILAPGTDPQKFVEDAMNHPGNDYLPTGAGDTIVAATALLGGGESDTIIFKVPAKPGEYPFVCSFPGHLQVGMGGVLSVK